MNLRHLVESWDRSAPKLVSLQDTEIFVQTAPGVYRRARAARVETFEGVRVIIELEEAADSTVSLVLPVTAA